MSVKHETFTRNKTEAPEFQNLKQDIDLLRKDLASLTSSLLKDAKSGAEQVLEGVNAKSSKVIEQTEAKISERPFLSLLASFVLGLVLAKVLESRNGR